MNFNNNRGGIFSNTPPVVKNLIIINVVMLILTWLAGRFFNVNLNSILGLYTPSTAHFSPYQYVTHIFMHGGFEHLFFNMFALWMFGRILEQVWGSKRFLIYFFVTGIGAALIHTGVNYLSLLSIKHDATIILNTPSPEIFAAFVSEHFSAYYDQVYSLFLDGWFKNPGSEKYISMAAEYTRQLIELQGNIPTVGASGAVYGVLLAFGMLFPNTQLMLLIPPIPIKAKWMVIGYGALELFLGLTQPGSNIAHFAHLGGMLFGYFLIKYWRKSTRNYY